MAYHRPWLQQSWEAQHADIKSFEGDHHWSQAKLQGGNRVYPLAENWTKDLLSMAPPIRTRPSFPHSQSIPSESFHKRLILVHQRADRKKKTKHNHRKLMKLITRITALSNSMKLWAMPCRATSGSLWRVLTKCGPLEKGMANYFSILGLRIQWTVWKGKEIRHWKMNSPGW